MSHAPSATVARDDHHDRSVYAIVEQRSPFSKGVPGSRGGYCGVMDTLRPRHQQSSSDVEQVRECAGDEQPVGVLRDAPVADLAEPEHPLDRADRMLNLRAHARLVAVGCFLLFAQRSVAMALVMGMVLGIRGRSGDRLALAIVGLVAPYAR